MSRPTWLQATSISNDNISHIPRVTELHVYIFPRSLYLHIMLGALDNVDVHYLYIICTCANCARTHAEM